MATTSINIQPIKGSSEAHNLRLKELDYVNKELTHLNQSISQDTIANRLEEIKTRYTQTTGQQMQKKATPIREGVIVIQEETTLQQLQTFAQDCETKFGFKAFQIHIHRDEGHRDIETQEWKPNLHAHLVFDWTDSNTGKSIKMNRQNMSELQTLCANSLGMERGVSSDKQHLNAIQFKAAETAKSIAQVSTLVETQENTLEQQETKQAVAKTVSKTAEKIGDLLGTTKNDREKEELKRQINALQEKVAVSERKAELYGYNMEVVQRKLDEEKSWHNSLKQNFENMKQNLGKLTREIGIFANILPENGLDWVKNNLPVLHKTMTEEKRKNNLSKDNKQGFSL